MSAAVSTAADLGREGTSTVRCCGVVTGGGEVAADWWTLAVFIRGKKHSFPFLSFFLETMLRMRNLIAAEEAR